MTGIEGRRVAFGSAYLTDVGELPEDRARSLTCPFIRDHNNHPILCMGSACMAWYQRSPGDMVIARSSDTTAIGEILPQRPWATGSCRLIWKP